MNIRELLIRIGVTGGVDSEREVNRVDESINNLKESVGNLGGILAGAFGFFSLGVIAHAADEMQTLEFRISQMTQTQGSAAQAFDMVGQHANDSRVAIESYVEAYAGIGAATHDLVTDQQDLLNITDSVAQGLQLAGANTQQTTSVMQQLTQAVAVGKLQWEDMRVILENSDAFAVRLAKSLGMTLQEMIKATQGTGGGIGAEKIINALRDMNADVTKTFKTMPMTISQALTIVTNRFDQMVHRFNRASGAISTVAGWIVEAMGYAEVAVDGLTRALGGGANAVKIFAIMLGSAGLVGGLKLLQLAIAAVFSPIGLLIVALTALYLIGEDVNGWLKGQPSLFGDMIGPVDKYRKEVDELSQGLSDLWEIAKSLLHTMTQLADFFNESQDWTAKIGKQTGLANIGPAIKDALSWEVQGIKDWAKWANYKTNGMFDLPQMMSDAVAGARQGNEERSGNYQRKLAFQQGYNDSGLNFNSPSVSGGRVTNLNVTIGNIDASGSSSSEDDVRRAAKTGLTDAFNAPTGYNSRLGDSLNFAGGGQ